MTGGPYDPSAKTCGECGMCCKLLAIDVLNKEAGQWCGHYRKGMGCGIYADRPAPCSGFRCEWLMSKELGPEWRPEKARFLMFYDTDHARLSVVVDPGSPHAWKREPYYSKIKQLSERTNDGDRILICIGDRRIVIFPDQDVDVGVVTPDHKIISGYATRDGQRIPYAMVVSNLEERPVGGLTTPSESAGTGGEFRTGPPGS